MTPYQPAGFPNSRHFPTVAVAALLLLSVAPGSADAKTASGMVTAEMRENAVRNVERYEWAKNREERLLRRVRPYLELSDEELWMLLPSQEIGRSRGVYSAGIGCPQCIIDHGGEINDRTEWNVDILGRPWQVQCRRCATWYPKNDFAAYYRSALDEQGKFRLGEGDSRYLLPRESVEGVARKWIDDGAGVRLDSYKWFFAACYGYAVWREMPQVLEAFAELYTLTNDHAYATKAAIILDRMAHLYPEMDETPGRQRGMTTSYGPGKVIGDGWEYGAIRQPAAVAYDYIFDTLRQDEEIIRAIGRLAERYNRPAIASFEDFNEHLRKNLLIIFVEDILGRGRAPPRGRDQACVAVVAAALDDSERTPRYLDWLFREDGGGLVFTAVEWMNRDGLQTNTGLVYSRTPAERMYIIADVLERYNRFKGTENHDMFREYPNLLNGLTLGSRLRILDKTHPMIGDWGSSMEINTREHPLDMLVNGYRSFPSRPLAREIWIRAGGDLERVELSPYEEDPGALLKSIREHVAGEPRPHESYNSGGWGFAVLQAPYRENGRAFGLFYGRAMEPSHSHADRLSLHLWAFGEVLIPDPGYPLYTGAWPKRHGYTRHVIGHSTVMIDDINQGICFSGKTRLFADAGTVRVADVNGLGIGVNTRGAPRGLYNQARTYRRAAVMVDVDEANSYLLDVFWVRGGDIHRLNQAGGGFETISRGLSPVRQNTGTAAGPDIGYGQEFDGELTWGYAGSGLQYLDNVERDRNPAERFWIEWKIDPRYPKPAGWDARLRIHNFTQVDEVILADGHPSRGHPDRMRYLLRSRFGTDLSTQFISVIEPYQREPFIESVRVLERIETEERFGAAVEVILRDGRRDVLLVSEEAGRVEAGPVRMDGRFGMVRFDASGQPGMITAVGAAEVRAGDAVVRQEAGKIAGRLVSFDDSDPHDVHLTLDRPVPNDVAGRYIIFDNTERSDASYRIVGVVGERTISIGQMPLQERLVDRDDFSKGMIYNIAPGDAFTIAQILTWTRK